MLILIVYVFGHNESAHFYVSESVTALSLVIGYRAVCLPSVSGVGKPVEVRFYVEADHLVRVLSLDRPANHLFNESFLEIVCRVVMFSEYVELGVLIEGPMASYFDGESPD